MVSFLFFFLNRRYRDKERSRPTTPPATTPRATTPSEKKATINVTVNPKSLSTGSTGSATKPTAAKVSKKIDMGAASTFGRNELGINSPTHRHTHAEEDLFSTNDDIVTTDNKANVLEDIFKTCPTPTPGDTAKADEDDFFNPREEENQEFGDFASAFSNASNKSAPVATAAEPVAVKKDDFADFTAAFETTPATATTVTPTNDSANLLFGANTNQHLISAPVAATLATTPSTQQVGDLLSELDGLSINTPVPNGE